MVQSGSILNVADNSGVCTVLCIQILKKRKRISRIGDELVVSVRSILTNRRVRLHCGEVLNALLIRKRGWLLRTDGTSLKFGANAVVLIQLKTKTLLASRIKGPVTRELRKKKYLRVICIASMVI